MTARKPHPIEVESYEVLRSRIDLSPMPPLWRTVVERIIHASADFDYAVDVITDERHLVRGLAALRGGAPVVTDVAMVAAGITAKDTLCMVGDPAAAPVSPTALAELVRRRVDPALIVGLPVGFVGAKESKQELRDSGLPQLSNFSEKGGSAVAAAALNALLYFEGVRR
jgi:precorrin-8X/cobalt-precorrin-8 methylmutase